MLPADSVLVEAAAKLRNLESRVKRLETLEFVSGGGDWVHIQTTKTGSDSATFTFSSITQSFLHLFIIIKAASDRTAPTTEELRMAANGTGAGGIFVGASADQDADFSAGAFLTPFSGRLQKAVVGIIGSQDNFNGQVAILIPFYSVSSVSKTFHSWFHIFEDTATEVNGIIRTGFSGGRMGFIETPVTSLEFSVDTGVIVEDSFFSLYGIRGTVVIA